MWQTKTFKTQDELMLFLKSIKNNHQYGVLFINNGYAVEYRPLKKLLS